MMTPYLFTPGRSDDISLLLCFWFYEPVYYIEPTDKTTFPSVSNQRKFVTMGWYFRKCWTCNDMVCPIDTTQKVISCSEIRPALDPKQRNLSLDPTTPTNFKMLDNDLSADAIAAADNDPADPTSVIFFLMGNRIHHPNSWINIKVLCLMKTVNQ